MNYSKRNRVTGSPLCSVFSHGLGHEDTFPRSRLSGHSAFSEETSAGRCRNEKDVPETDLAAEVTHLRVRPELIVRRSWVRGRAQHGSRSLYAPALIPCMLLGTLARKISGYRRPPDLRAALSEEEAMSVVAVWSNLH